jgi:hypothetical protein
MYLDWFFTAKRKAVKTTVLEYLNSGLYYPCVLLVARDIATPEKCANALAAEADWPLLSVGGKVSSELINTSPARWGRAARTALLQRVRGAGSGPLVLLHVDLLFDPMFKLDPLALLREASRVTPLAVAWPGGYDGSTLSYAVPEHTHYRTWRDPQVGVLQLRRS